MTLELLTKKRSLSAAATTKKSNSVLLIIFTLLSFCSRISMSQSSPESFFTKLEGRIEEVNSHLCVGLDPHIKEIFSDIKDDSSALAAKTEEERCDAAYTFCKKLIDATG